jgi:ABC-type nitrate/sulfonate/bicarbonate transport system substrate-binding protein
MNMSHSLKTTFVGAALTASSLFGTQALAADELRVALPAKMFLNLVEFVAEDRGFYEDQGLEVEMLHIADSSVPVRSLISGDVGLSQAGMSETLIAAGKGADVKTIGGVHAGLHYAFWTRAGAGIDSIADLPGKNVAISSPGSLPHVVTLALLRKANVPQEEIDTINWVAVKGSSARRNAILTGTVDATVASYSPEAERSDDMNLLSIVGKELPNYIMLSMDTTGTDIADRRDTLKKFITAELLATRFILDNKEEALETAKDHFDYSEEDLGDFYQFYVDGEIWNPNGLIDEEAVKYMQQLNVDAGMQDEVLPVEQVLDQSIVREVLEEIGHYEE